MKKYTMTVKIEATQQMSDPFKKALCGAVSAGIKQTCYSYGAIKNLKWHIKVAPCQSKVAKCLEIRDEKGNRC